MLKYVYLITIVFFSCHNESYDLPAGILYYYDCYGCVQNTLLGNEYIKSLNSVQDIVYDKRFIGFIYVDSILIVNRAVDKNDLKYFLIDTKNKEQYGPFNRADYYNLLKVKKLDSTQFKFSIEFGYNSHNRRLN